MNAYLDLLNQALIRYNAAVQNDNFIAADCHRRIFLALFPLAFANAMQDSLAGGCLSKN